MNKILFLLVKVVALMSACNVSTPCPECPKCGDDPPIVSPDTTYSAKVGINAFTWTPLQMLDTFKQVRLYISTSFICTEKGLFVEPIYRSRSDIGDGLDSYLKEAQRRGISVTLCINQSPEWMQGGTAALSNAPPQSYLYDRTSSRGISIRKSGSDLDHPPVRPGADRTKPESYAVFAGVLEQLAARYGKNKVPDTFLKVDSSPRWNNDPPNQRLSGLGISKLTIEVWNEPDKWWRKGDGTGVYMEPNEYGAMLKICYDKIKAVDPSIQVAMAGLTDFDMAYLNAMDAYFKQTNGGMWPCDVINVHHYSNEGNIKGKHPPTWIVDRACSVTKDNAFPAIAEVVKFAKDRGKKVWCSEFGYDTRSPSWMHPTPVQGKSGEQLQAEYLVEAYRLYILAGVDAAFAFNANDELGANNGGLYQSSGILYGESHPQKFSPKQSYFDIIKTLK